MRDSKRRGVQTASGRRIGKNYQTPRDITARRNRHKFTSKTSQSQLPQCILLLKASRNRLESKSAWTKGAWARDVDENMTAIVDPNAVSWCAEGILERTCRDLKLSHRHFVFCRLLFVWLLKPRKFRNVIHFNDAETTKHFDVLALFTRGIAVIEEALNYRSHFNYIQRGRGRLEKIVSNRQQEKEHPSP